MKLSQPRAKVFVPDGVPVDEALARTTHLAIAAHQDDIEIMAYDGILKCFSRKDAWFTGTVVADGSGSPRSGLYETCSDDDMCEIRILEQERAAVVGEYAAQVFLDYPSARIKDPSETNLVNELYSLLEATRPRFVYLHNLADKHPTHVGVVVKAIAALRRLAPEALPEKVYGCEVWRGLDWMINDDKVFFNVQGRNNLERALLGVFDSQICGGKRYDLATEGRRLANATYAESHSVDETNALMLAMDLTPLVHDSSLDICDFVLGKIDHFAEDVRRSVTAITGP
ncbi:MAG: PIG-L family deacetylase [Oscillospiraceae bacterium]|nr:PIG-L family deacetylase [Oscillospiraceae bacterium]